MSDLDPVLHINNLRLSLPVGGSYQEILHGVDLEIKKGRILGILGESGSGKTVTMTAATGLLDQGYCKIHSGTAMLKQRGESQNLLCLSDKALADIRGKRVGFVFQNAIDSMNPYKKISTQMREVYKLHRLKPDNNQIISALSAVGITDSKSVLNMYPTQLSGGMAQRVMIAMAGLLSPDVIIADEPTSAIDASLRKMVLDLFISVKNSMEISIAVITHDFEVVAYACDDVAVMYSGLIMEKGLKSDIMNTPKHPYTLGLIKCAESLGKGESNLFELMGHPPAPHEYKNICPFIERCSYKTEICEQCLPEVQVMGSQHVRCHNPVGVRL